MDSIIKAKSTLARYSNENLAYQQRGSRKCYDKSSVMNQLWICLSWLLDDKKDFDEMSMRVVDDGTS